jgi:uncharacterized MAPEG superfamily protein
MTVPFACIAVAFSLLFLTKVPVAIAMGTRPEGYDNHNPRDQQALLAGWGRRALGAHLNAFESFPAFAAGVLVANAGHADPRWSAILAIGHVVARVAYTAAYIADIHLVRTALWGLATLCAFALMLLPLWV